MDALFCCMQFKFCRELRFAGERDVQENPIANPSLKGTMRVSPEMQSKHFNCLRSRTSANNKGRVGCWDRKKICLTSSSSQANALRKPTLTSKLLSQNPDKWWQAFKSMSVPLHAVPQANGRVVGYFDANPLKPDMTTRQRLMSICLCHNATAVVRFVEHTLSSTKDAGARFSSRANRGMLGCARDTMHWNGSGLHNEQTDSRADGHATQWSINGLKSPNAIALVILCIHHGILRK